MELASAGGCQAVTGYPLVSVRSLHLSQFCALYGSRCVLCSLSLCLVDPQMLFLQIFHPGRCVLYYILNVKFREGVVTVLIISE